MVNKSYKQKYFFLNSGSVIKINKIKKNEGKLAVE